MHEDDLKFKVKSILSLWSVSISHLFKFKVSLTMTIKQSLHINLLKFATLFTRILLNIYHENKVYYVTTFSSRSYKYREASFIRDAFIRKHRNQDVFFQERKNAV